MRLWPTLSLCTYLALPTPAVAQSARWVTISKTKDQRIEVDTADVGITSSLHVTVWWRLTNRLPHTSPSVDSPSRTVRWSMLTDHEEIDCHEKETRIIQQVLYSSSGDVVDSFKADSLAPWNEPPPDSVLEFVMRWSCEHL